MTPEQAQDLGALKQSVVDLKETVLSLTKEVSKLRGEVHELRAQAKLGKGFIGGMLFMVGLGGAGAGAALKSFLGN